jgi:hypothetical protein
MSSAVNGRDLVPDFGNRGEMGVAARDWNAAKAIESAKEKE